MINIVLYYEEIICSLESGRRIEGVSLCELYWFVFFIFLSLWWGEFLNIDESYVLEFGSKMLEVEEWL